MTVVDGLSIPRFRLRDGDTRSVGWSSMSKDADEGAEESDESEWLSSSSTGSSFGDTVFSVDAAMALKDSRFAANERV